MHYLCIIYAFIYLYLHLFNYTFLIMSWIIGNLPEMEKGMSKKDTDYMCYCKLEWSPKISSRYDDGEVRCCY